MKPFAIRLFFKKIAIALFLFMPFAISGQGLPKKPEQLVNDYTKSILSVAESNHLEKKLVTFSDSTSIQIAVVIIPSLKGADIADYAVRLAEYWGIGHKKRNNGILILVSVNDRKVTIQTGYGIESFIPDAIARRIIEREIKPAFKKGDYYAGLDRAIDAIITYTKGAYKSDPLDVSHKEVQGFFAGILIITLILLLIFLMQKGGKNQVIDRCGGANFFWWFLAGNTLGSFRKESDEGSDGNDFGGFGGGSFGGGGASGSW